MQPGTGRSPVALHGRGRDPHHLRGFLQRKAGKESQLHYAALPRIDLSKGIEGIVDRDDEMCIRDSCRSAPLKPKPGLNGPPARSAFSRDQATSFADLEAALGSASPRNTVLFSPAMPAVVPGLPWAQQHRN